MAKSRRWSKYEPPQRRRTESGRLEDAPSPVAKKASVKAPTTRKPATTTSKKSSAAAARSARKVWLTVLGGVGGLIALIVLIAVARGGDGEGSVSDYEVETLREGFIADGLVLAATEAPAGSELVGLELNEYELRAEYFDPNRDKTKYLVYSVYDADDGGYSIDVRDSYYDDYAPRPIELDQIAPADLISAAEQVLDEADDPYSWSVRVAADYDSGEVSMVAEAYGDESAEITRIIG